MPLRIDTRKICTVKCDFCGRIAGSENFPWVTANLAQVGAREEGWVTRGGANCCPACKVKKTQK